MRLRLLITVLAIAAFWGEAFAAELSITLPPSIEAREGSFCLGEYADIEGEREIADSVSMAVIAHDGSFSRVDVVNALAGTEAAGMSVAISMPDEVEVRPESKIAADLRAMTAWKWRVDVDVVPGGWDKLMAGYSGYVLPPKIIPGARSLAVKLEDEGGRQFNKQVKVTWYQPVVYSTRPLAKNDPVSVQSLRTRMGTAAMMMTNFSSPEQLAGAKARRAVNAMTALETGDISQDSFVRSGTSVTMVARVNGLGVEVRGVAMQRGGMGDTIKVKNLASKKILKARVIGPDKVEIIQ